MTEGQGSVGDGPVGSSPAAPPEPAAEGPAYWGYAEILLLGAVGLTGAFLVSAATVAIAGRAFGVGESQLLDLMSEEPRVAVPVQCVTWLPVLAVVAYVVRVRCRMSLRQGLAWRALPYSQASYLRIGALLAMGSILVSFAIGEGDGPSPMSRMISNREGLWVLALYGVVIAPCVEEILFRGFLFAPLQRLHGTGLALLVTSAVFAVLHGAQYGWEWPRLAVLMAVGSALCAVRVRSDSAKASALVHATYNGILFATVLLAPLG